MGADRHRIKAAIDDSIIYWYESVQKSQTPEQGNTSRADPGGPEGSRCVEDQKRCNSFSLRFSRAAAGLFPSVQ